MQYENMKAAEICDCHFKVISEKESHTRCAAVETKPTNEYVWTTPENQKENLVCLSSLSPYDILFIFG